jgi:hypothetical protein
MMKGVGLFPCTSFVLWYLALKMSLFPEQLRLLPGLTVLRTGGRFAIRWTSRHGV